MSAIVLVGLMGTGKTTVGRLVAERTGRPLIDADDAIEARTGRTVRELWEEGGEAAYRSLESAVVLDHVDDDVVVAAPGGVVLDEAVRSALVRADLVVWLRAEPATAAARVHAGDHRPLLGDDPLTTLTAMATDRAPRYQAVADAIVDVDHLDPAAIADRIVARAEP